MDDEAADTPPITPRRIGAKRATLVLMGANALLALGTLWVWGAPLPGATPSSTATPSTGQPTATYAAPQLATTTPGFAQTATVGAPAATATATPGKTGGGGGSSPTATPTIAAPTATPSPTATPTATPIPPTPTYPPTPNPQS